VQANHVADAGPISLNEIKEMGVASAPCISILISSDEFPVRLKHALEKVKVLLESAGVNPAESRQLLREVEGAVAGVEPTGKASAIYCAPEFCRAFHLPDAVAEVVTVGNHFYVKPLIPSLQAERPFYVLALSQKHIRLLRCTEDQSAEMELPPTFPVNAGNGGVNGAVFSTNPDDENHLEHLAHFYKQVSEGVTAFLRERADDSPLVVAGVDYEIACFRRVNVYPHLVEEPVHGAPDGLKGGELHKRALEAVRSYFEAPFRAVVARYERAGLERSSSTVKDIVKAAFDGRVLDLVLAEGAQYMGSFDDQTRSVKGHKQPMPGDEDLLNVAALQTLLHAGQVFVVPTTQIPHGAPAIAVYRY